TKTLSPSFSLAARARSTRSGSDGEGRSPGHSTPRSLLGSASRPRSSRARGVGCTSSSWVWAVVTTRTLSVLRLAGSVWTGSGGTCGTPFRLFVELTLSIITASRHFDDGHSVHVT